MSVANPIFDPILAKELKFIEDIVLEAIEQNRQFLISFLADESMPLNKALDQIQDVGCMVYEIEKRIIVATSDDRDLYESTYCGGILMPTIMATLEIAVIEGEALNVSALFIEIEELFKLLLVFLEELFIKIAAYGTKDKVKERRERREKMYLDY